MTKGTCELLVRVAMLVMIFVIVKFTRPNACATCDRQFIDFLLKILVWNEKLRCESSATFGTFRTFLLNKTLSSKYIIFNKIIDLENKRDKDVQTFC